MEKVLYQRSVVNSFYLRIFISIYNIYKVNYHHLAFFTFKNVMYILAIACFFLYYFRLFVQCCLKSRLFLCWVSEFEHIYNVALLYIFIIFLLLLSLLFIFITSKLINCNLVDCAHSN